METIGTGVIAAVLVLALGGCVPLPLHESNLEGTMPAKTSALVVGQSDRTQVRQALGEPWLASRYWGLDLYRASDKNSQILLMLLPMGVPSEDVNGFILVAYDVDAAVVAYDQEISQDPSIFFSPNIPVDAALEAGDARFQTAADGQEAYVSVAVAVRDRYLHDVSVGTQCRVILGCGQAYCPARVAIDGGLALELPTGFTSLQPEVAVVSLPPGKHRVEATPAQGVEFSATVTEFICAAGEAQHIALRLELDRRPMRFRLKRHFAAAFEISPQMPEAFRESPLLIWLNGQWLVPQEP